MAVKVDRKHQHHGYVAPFLHAYESQVLFTAPRWIVNVQLFLVRPYVLVVECFVRRDTT